MMSISKKRPKTLCIFQINSLQQELDSLIKSFETSETKFIEQMTKKDEERRLKSQDFLTKIQGI